MKVKLTGSYKEIRELLLYIGREYLVDQVETIDDFAEFSVVFCNIKEKDG